MKLSLHTVIIGEPLSFEELLALAQKTGYEGVDTGFGEAKAMGKEAFLALCDRYGVQMSSWPMAVEWRKDEETFRAGMEGLAADSAFAAELGCTRTCTWIPPGVDSGAAETRKVWMARWGEIAKVIADHGHRFGLEWVAPYHTRAGKDVVVWRMDDLLQMEDEIGEPNLGLLVDSFHWFNAGHTPDELRALPAEKIVHVHLNDAPDRPLEEQQDMERLPAGEGIIDLDGFLGALKAVGYADYMGVEIFSAELKTLPAEEAARRARVGADAVLARIG